MANRELTVPDKPESASHDGRWRDRHNRNSCESPSLTAPAIPGSEEGFSTAELLGNAALGIAALVVIWAALTGVGEQVITYIRNAILGG